MNLEERVKVLEEEVLTLKALLASDTFKKESEEFNLHQFCIKYDLSIFELTSSSRDREIVALRDIIIYGASKHYKLKHRQLANIFNRDRSSITNSLQRTEDRLFIKDELYTEFFSKYFSKV